MTPDFNVGDHITDLTTGEQFTVTDYFLHMDGNVLKRMIKIKSWSTNYTKQISEVYWSGYQLTSTLPPHWMPKAKSYAQHSPVSPLHFSLDKDGNVIVKLPDPIEFVPISFTIDGVTKTCDHEWVTWTGLHGTITDCTKCKAVKND